MILGYKRGDHMEWAAKKWKYLFLAPEFYSVYKARKMSENIYKQLLS